MTRDEMYDTIEHLTVVMKFAAADTVATIKEATGLSVNPDADDLLETLNDSQLEAVCQRFSELEQEIIHRNSKLTFEQFQSSRREADAAAIETAGYTVSQQDVPELGGYIYVHTLVIEDTRTWPEDSRSKPYCKRYYLMLGNQEYFSDTLEELERKLYEYAVSEELC